MRDFWLREVAGVQELQELQNKLLESYPGRSFLKMRCFREDQNDEGALSFWEVGEPYREGGGEMVDKRAQVLGASSAPISEVLGQRFIPAHGRTIQKCDRCPSARLGFENRQQLDSNNRVPIALSGITAERRLMLIKPVGK